MFKKKNVATEALGTLSYLRTLSTFFHILYTLKISDHVTGGQC